MTEAFRTDTVFGAEDQITPKLREIITALRAANRVANTLKETFASLQLPTPKMPPLGPFRAAGEAAGRAFAAGFRAAAGGGMGGGMGGGFSGGASRGGAGGGGPLALTGGSSGRFSPVTSPLMLTGGGGGVGGGGGSNNAVAVPGMPPLNVPPMGGFGGGAGGGGGGLGNLAAGAMLEHYGVRILDHIGHVAEQGMKYDSEVQQLKNSGYTDAEIAKTVKAAWAVAGAVPTTTATENIKVANELRYALGSAQHGLDALQAVQEMTGVLQSVTGGKMGGTEAYAAARYLEMTNRASNSEQFNSGLDQITRVVIASRGKVTPTQMLGFAQQAGSQYTSNISDEERYAIMPRIIQEMGGMRAGTGYAAIMRELVGGVISKRSAEGLEALGIINPADVQGKGVSTRLRAGAIPEMGLLSSDMSEWVQKYVAPKLVGHTASYVSAAIARAFGTGPSQREIAIEVMQGRVFRPGVDQDGVANSPIERDRAIYHTIQSGTYQELLKANPMVQLAAFNTSWENFTTALGHAIVPIIVPALRLATTALTTLAEFFMAHPTIAENIIKVAAALGVAAIVMGTLAVAVGIVLIVAGTAAAPFVLLAGVISAVAVYAVSAYLHMREFGVSIKSLGEILGAIIVGNWIMRIATGMSILQVALRGLGASALTANAVSVAFSVLGRSLLALLGPIAAFLAVLGYSTPLNGKEGSADTRKMGLGVKPNSRGQVTGDPRNEGVPSSIHTGSATHHVSTNLTVNLDGRQLTKQITYHMAREINRPSSGPSGYDGTMSPMQPAQKA